MILEVCDICRKNEPDKRIKIKMSERHKFAPYDGWMVYKKIHVCQECAEKILGFAHEMTTQDIVDMIKYNTEE